MYDTEFTRKTLDCRCEITERTQTVSVFEFLTHWSNTEHTVININVKAPDGSFAEMKQPL